MGKINQWVRHRPVESGGSSPLLGTILSIRRLPAAHVRLSAPTATAAKAQVYAGCAKIPTFDGGPHRPGAHTLARAAAYPVSSASADSGSV
jgi:hypothetical protein